MSRSAIIGLGVLVLGGLAVVWLLVVRDDPAPASDPAAPPAAAATTDSRPTGVGPSLPAGAPTLAAGSGAKPTAKDSTGLVVTDHRTHDGEPRTMPAEHVDTGPVRKLQPTIVRSVHSNVSALAAGCARSVPKDARGTKPRLTAKVTVGITGGSMFVRSATTDATDMTGPEVETAKQCLHDQLMGYQLPTPDEDDLESYDLELSFLVR